MSTKPGDTPIDVTWEDQKRICVFSRLHKKIQHLKSKHQRLADDLDKLEDASTEVMICDEVKYVFGEAFVDLPSDDVVELLESDKSRLSAEREEVEKELGQLEAALSDLKAQLYAKFGSQIYLEDK